MAFIETTANFLAYLNVIFIDFLLVGILLTILFTRNWKFRFARVKSHPNLRPYSKTYKIVWIFIIVTLFIFPLIGALITWLLPKILIGLGITLQLLILFFFAPLTYLWVKLRVISRKKFGIYDFIPITISILSLLLFFIIYLNN